MSSDVAVVSAPEPSAPSCLEGPRSWHGGKASDLHARIAAEARRARQVASRNRRDAARLRAAVRMTGEESIRLRWRARKLRYDRLGPILAMWTDDQPHQPAPPGGPITGAAAASIDLRTRDSLHPIIGRLFSITVEISSALTLNGDPELGKRLQRILDKTDEVIRDLRAAASSVPSGSEVAKVNRQQVRRGCHPENGSVNDVQPRELASTLLAEAIHTIDRLARFARENSEAAAMELEEASHAAHRALVVLAPSNR